MYALKQEEFFSYVDSVISDGKAAHAYLVAGAGEEEREGAVLYFVKRLLCRENFPDFCNCSDCRKADNLSHPDVLAVSVKEDATVIKVEQVRELKAWAYVKPLEAVCKVVIFKNPELLTLEGANALLKVLEEPPQNLYFVFTSANSAKVLDTIYSRLIEVKLKNDSIADIHSVLLKDGLDDKEARLLSEFSLGSLMRARKLAENSFYKKNSAVAESFFSEGIVSFFDYNFSSNEEFLDFLHILYLLFRDILYAKSGDVENIVNMEFKSEITSFSKSVKSDTIIRFMERIDKSMEFIDKRANKKMILASLVSEFVI